MGLFGLGKKKDVLDLSEKYKKDQDKLFSMKEEAQEISSQASSPTQSAFGFLDNLSSSSNSSSEESSEYVDVAGSVGDRKKKLAKRFMDMTNKLEDLSNQIYHLQQRIEVLERKSGVGSFG